MTDLSAFLALLNQREGGADPLETRRVAKTLVRLASAASDAIRDQGFEHAAGQQASTFAQTLEELADG
ncbi:MAG: hypothetical protein R3E68_15110 [Burkholderiaceae bacterium]